jgi:hypothetical protein
MNDCYFFEWMRAARKDTKRWHRLSIHQKVHPREYKTAATRFSSHVEGANQQRFFGRLKLRSFLRRPCGGSYRVKAKRSKTADVPLTAYFVDQSHLIEKQTRGLLLL